MRFRTLSVLLLVPVGACKHRGDDLDEDGFTFEDGDCDDEDASVNPDAAEVIYDNIDQDCDPSNDAALSFERIPRSESGRRLGGPRLARSGDLVQVNLVYRNDGVNTSAWSMATYDGTTGRMTEDYREVMDTDGLQFELGPVLDASQRPGSNTLLATSMVTEEGNLRATLFHIEPSTDWSWGGHGPSGVTKHFDDVALWDDGEQISLAACGADRVQWLSGTLTDFIPDLTYDFARADARAVNCEVQGREVRALDAGGVVSSYTPEGEDLVVGATWESVVDLAWEPEGMLLARKDGLTLETDSETLDLVTGASPARARFDVSPDGDVFVVYATESGDLFMLHGQLGAALTEVHLGDELGSDEVDVEATKDVIAVAARSGDDAWIAAVERRD